MTQLPSTVAIVDDDASVRRSLSRLLKAHDLAVETFDSAGALLAAGTLKAIGCIILDVQMPGLDGLALQERLASKRSATPIVFLTGHGDIPMSVRAMKAGASDFLTKPVDETILLAAVRDALDGHWRQLEAQQDHESERLRLSELTAREREVLGYVLSGARNRQIADHLRITEKTVKVHRSHIMQKLQVSTVADLALLCARSGVDPLALPGASPAPS